MLQRHARQVGGWYYHEICKAAIEVPSHVQRMASSGARRFDLWGWAGRFAFMSRVPVDVWQNHGVIAWLQPADAVVHGEDDPNALVSEGNIAVRVTGRGLVPCDHPD